MKIIKSSLIISILFLAQVVTAQEWSSRITIIEEHLVEIPIAEVEEISDSKQIQIDFVQDGGDVFTVENGNLNAGINMLFEEVLEGGFLVKEMFVYSVGISYDIGRFGLSFSFENFLNAGQQESDILPIPEYYGSDVVNAVTYELDSPYSLTLGLTFSF